MESSSTFHPALLDVVLPVGAAATPPYTGTAFLYGKRFPNESDVGFVVTNKHVIETVGRYSEDGVILHVNLLQGGATPVTIPFSSWTFHDSADVAVYMVGFPLPLPPSMNKWFLPDLFYTPRASLKDQAIGEGSPVFVVGFPLGLGGHADISYPFVRQGIVAQIQPWIDGNSDSIVIDANAYPGSSGSPVFVKQGEAAEIRLLGIVSSYIPYEEELVSRQTGETMAVSIENSGLALVIPVEYIEETIDKKMRQ